MKFFFEPKVYLIARPSLVIDDINKFLLDEELGDWAHGDDPVCEGAELCEFMGRLCYRSFGAKQGRTGNTSYIKNIIAQGHGSVLEHANWSFVVARCGRGYTHQQVRHRAGWAYSQESTHFIEYEPDSARAALAGMDALMDYNELESAKVAVEAGLAAYVRALAPLRDSISKGKLSPRKAKKAKCGIARNLLPTGIESMLGFTANARALRWFLTLRGADDNVVEIRMVAAQVLEHMRREAPVLFDDFETYEADDGFVALRNTGKGKV